MTTSASELMTSLNTLITSRQVLYLGISDAPAWFVVKCNAFATHHGLRPFSVYQGKYSAAERDLERDVFPMCRDQGMGVAAYGTLGGGYFKLPEGEEGEEEKKDKGRNMPDYKPKPADAVTAILARIAKQKGEGVSITSVALAYAMRKTPYLFPIVGGRKVEHLKANVEALELELEDSE
ncbi:MAG: hypothetical protein Q9168_007106, partial [Polycauliona sp. 1 TL-2023]